MVADRERHVGTQHNAVGSHHLHDKSQHPDIVQDSVGVDQRQRLSAGSEVPGVMP
jgi:hypothetical protein